MPHSLLKYWHKAVKSFLIKTEVPNSLILMLKAFLGFKLYFRETVEGYK